MKKRGFLLIYVIILLAFIGMIAFYSMERMRLAILVEENRIATIRDKAELEGNISYLLEKGNAEAIMGQFKAHITGPHAAESKEYPLSLIGTDGAQTLAHVAIDGNKQSLSWRFTPVADAGSYHAEQIVETPLDQTSGEGGLSLDAKMAFLKERIVEAGLPFILSDTDLRIQLAKDKKHWEVYQLQSKEEPEDAESEEVPVTEPQETDNPVPESPPDDTDTETSYPEEPEPEVLPDETDTEESLPPDPEGSEPVAEPPSTEDLAEPEWEWIATFPDTESVFLIVMGHVRIEAMQIAQKAPFLGTILLEGDLDLLRTEIKGIVLQKGTIHISKTSKINGYYESDRVVNLGALDYTRANPRKMLAGMDIPGFLSLKTLGVYTPPPDNFPDP